MYSSGPPHMAGKRQDDKLKHTYSNSSHLKSHKTHKLDNIKIKNNLVLTKVKIRKDFTPLNFTQCVCVCVWVCVKKRTIDKLTFSENALSCPEYADV